MSNVGRLCSICNEVKDLSDFYSHNVSKGPYKGTRKMYRACKDCIQISRRASKYKVPFETVKFLLSKNTCDICGGNGSEFKKGMHIDHCHSTGALRGVLCHSCNVGIGLFKDDISLMQKAMEYLSKCQKQ
jgi:hypothetical protein